MRLRAFCEARNLKAGTVSAYINRHKDIKDNCKRVNKELELNNKALSLLSEKYPLPEPIQVIQGVDPEEYEKLQLLLANTQEKLDRAYDRIEAYEEKLISYNETLAKLEAKEDELSRFKLSIFGLYRKRKTT